MLAQLLHIQVAPACQPLLRLLDRQRRNQPQARLPVWEDPHHPRPALYLLVETFEAVSGADAPEVALGEGQAREAFPNVLFEVAGDLLMALLAPFLGHARCDPEGLFPAPRGCEDRSQVRPKLFTLGNSDHAEEVPTVVDLAPLPRCSLEVAEDSSLETLVVI